MATRKVISLDWAIKRILRSKANFEVLEGFLSELLKENITILEVLDSESNQEERQAKLSRVDLKVKNSKNEIILIEVQYEREMDYLQRILFSASTAIVEHLRKGSVYANVVKVISVNILYFNLGMGKDYVYHGKTSFTGIHQNDELQLDAEQSALFRQKVPANIFPEYYLLKINQFNDKAKDTLDEWIYFLKNEVIKDSFKAKGIKKAAVVLDVLKLNEAEKKDYDAHMAERSYQASMYLSSFGRGKTEGKAQGKAEGLSEGMALGIFEGQIHLCQDMLQQNRTPTEVLVEKTLEELEALLKILKDQLR